MSDYANNYEDDGGNPNPLFDTWSDEAIDGYLEGAFGVGSRCDAGHSLYVVNCTDCAILQMRLSRELATQAGGQS